MITKKEDYNNEPVKHCNRCLSLKILFLESRDNTAEVDYCAKCGSIEIEESHIEKWRILHNNMYKKDIMPEISSWREKDGIKYHYFEFKNDSQEESIMNILNIFVSNNPEYTLHQEKGRVKICRAI